MTESSAIDKRARGLVEQLVQLHTAVNDSAEGGAGAPNLGPQIAVVETTLADYLREHREVLGRLDYWRGHYEELDNLPLESF
ncbi:hypothetical protein [Nocardia salmonicida]|uniref:hypothetical protein n=1 Tax=Nocardia salmonicida TaxID=53431 RepID=UPI0007A3E35D|nr:hypothetical protein [Nocardia salmonicida]